MISKTVNIVTGEAIRKGMTCLVTAALLAGCSVKPEPFSAEAHIARARADMMSLFSKHRPVERELTLSDAIARGLTDNLDHRLAMMEKVLQESRLSVVQYDMLPSLAANAGYDWRDREAASSSISLNTRNQSLEPSFSSERTGVDAGLRFSWSLLDFGLSYYQAKQQADQVSIAVETRRRVMNNTARDIVSAYYRAAAAEKLLPKVRDAIGKAEKALAASDQIRREKLVPAQQMLVYKRDVLQYMLALRNHENSLYRAREELATLINVSPEELKLAPAGKVRPEKITTDVAALQDHALVYRAELREEAYKERIDAYEVRRETLRLFPGLTAISSINYDSNKYLYYSTWKEMGLQASWNLIDLLKGRKSLAAAKAQVDYTRERRLALSSAILAQAAISYYQYEEARNTFATTDALRDVEQGLLKVARDNEKAESGSVLESLRQNVASISAQIDADRAYADTQTALASLLVSIGYDLVPPDAAMDDPDVLVRDMAPVLGALEKGKLPDVAPKGRLLKLDAASSAPAPAAPVVPAAAPVKVGTPVKKAAAEKPAAAVAAKAPAAPAKPVPSAPPVRKAEVNKAATMEKTAKTAAKQPPAAAKVAPNRATASAAAVNPEGRLPPELFAMPGQAGNASQKGRDCVIANDGSDKNSWSNRLRRRFFGEKMECAN